jgi:hypothetical protein
MTRSRTSTCHRSLSLQVPTASTHIEHIRVNSNTPLLHTLVFIREISTTQRARNNLRLSGRNTDFAETVELANRCSRCFREGNVELSNFDSIDRTSVRDAGTDSGDWISEILASTNCSGFYCEARSDV